MTPPTIHLNGTSRESLLEGYNDAFHALHKAREALQDSAPNVRDYYVNPDAGAFARALTEHDARLEKLTAIMGEMTALADAISE